MANYCRNTNSASPFDAVNDAKTLTQNTPLTFSITSLLKNDTYDVSHGIWIECGKIYFYDKNGNRTSITFNDKTTHGNFVLNRDNTITYTPDRNYVGVDNFEYTISNNKGQKDTATVTLNVEKATVPVPPAPPAASGFNTTNDNINLVEDTTKRIKIEDLLKNDPSYKKSTGVQVGENNIYFWDVNGKCHKITFEGQTSKGTPVVVDRTTREIIYTPAKDFSGTDSFKYTVTEWYGKYSSTATVTLNIENVNDAPVVNAITTSVNEDSSIDINVLDGSYDVDGNTLTVTEVHNDNGEAGRTNHGGTVTVNTDGTINYISATDFNGTDTFTYTVTDGNGGVVTQMVTVNVTPVNDAPQIVIPPVGTQEVIVGKTLEIDLPENAFFDVDGDSLTVTATLTDGQPLPSWIVWNEESFTFTAQPTEEDLVGTYGIVLTVNDGQSSVSQSFDLNVALKESPTFTLGGRDVPYSLAGSAISTLWEREVEGHQIHVTPYAYFSETHPETNIEGEFALEKKGNVIRGIGVKSKRDTEIEGPTPKESEGREAIKVDFGGLRMATVEVGVRALFIERVVPKFEYGYPDETHGKETAVWKAYLNGAEVGTGTIEADEYYQEPTKAYDGKAEVQIHVPNGFDTLVFFAANQGSEFFLEYINAQLPGEVEVDHIIHGTTGDDMLSGTTFDDIISGDSGNDTLEGKKGNDTLKGEAGDDTVYGGEGDDTIEGGNGNDTLYGDNSAYSNVAGHDTIRGGDGDDRIFAGKGQDDIFGEAGKDTFVFSTLQDSTTGNEDVIHDFIHGEDKIDLVGMELDSGAHLQFADLHFEVAGDTTHITVSGHSEFSLEVVSNNLQQPWTQSDFTFFV